MVSSSRWAGAITRAVQDHYMPKGLRWRFGPVSLKPENDQGAGASALGLGYRTGVTSYPGTGRKNNEWERG